jgi:hypothetical protein
MIVLPLIALMVWVVISDTYFYDETTRGVDNAPRFAAIILGFLVTAIYVVYLFILSFARLVAWTLHADDNPPAQQSPPPLPPVPRTVPPEDAGGR